ncbi:echinoderm microtubule-associated protein-like CG42247 [Ceratitis capitata]|uniref:echinoderm microtubule-associated protein-like CG42247 n=1 Tax=Ceratitis capitata TaxID=7213 RepID=UPI00032A14D7|nr:echinoderm microtubule-associated protein-like CG42247 [Ceratitis capitata]
MSANEAGDGAAELTNGVTAANESAATPAPSPAAAAQTSSPPASAATAPQQQQQQQPDGAMDNGNATAEISSAAQFEGGVSNSYGAVKQFNETNSNNNGNNVNYTSKSNGYHNQHNGNNNSNQFDNPGSNRSSPLKSPQQQQHYRGVGRESSFQPISVQQHHLCQTVLDDSDNEDYELQGAAGGLVGDYWQQRNGIVGAPASGGRQSRAPPLSPTYVDNMSENSEQPPMVPLVRSKSRPELSSNAQLNSAMSAASRYNNLSYWKARRVVFYRNGDPFFPGVELRYRPGRDITSLDSLLDKISPKMDLPRGARYVFSMDGDRKYHLDELEDGASYVVSSFKAFKMQFEISSGIETSYRSPTF